MSDIEDLLSQAKTNLEKTHEPVEKSLQEEVFSIPKLQAKISAPRVISSKPALKEIKREKPKKEDTAGAQWFNLGTPEMTSELKRDLQLLKMRHVLDPKRFYKTADEQSKYFAVGTLKEDSTEFYSSRMSRKDRKQTLAEEILNSRPEYFKSRFDKIQAKKRSGGKGHYKKIKSMRR